jgi:hypothetical protein
VGPVRLYGVRSFELSQEALANDFMKDLAIAPREFSDAHNYLVELSGQVRLALCKLGAVGFCVAL